MFSPMWTTCLSIVMAPPMPFPHAACALFMGKSRQEAAKGCDTPVASNRVVLSFDFTHTFTSTFLCLLFG